MPPHLLKLPTELLERILSLLCHENARSIQACRQACRTLNTIIAQSQLVQYLERVALLGTYDPLLLEEGGASATLALPDRAAALRAWEEAWNALTGGHDGDARVFWQERAPDLRIALPPRPSSSSSPSRVNHILATIVDPDPAIGPLDGDEGQHGILDEDDHFSFGPWFIIATRDGLNVRASYSYLDLHGCLNGVGGAGGGGEEEAPSGAQVGEQVNRDLDGGADYDRVCWTCIKIPVWNVVAFGLSTELDLAVIISTQFEHQDQEWGRKTRTHWAVRPLRFRDGTPHPCAKVPTMRFSVTATFAFYETQAQVLGDYLLLWIWPAGNGLGDCLGKIYLIAWKQGTITLLRENIEGKYGAVRMISNDVLALVQLDPPGIELCRLSNVKKEAEDGEGEGGAGDGGGDATNDRNSQNDGPRIDKICTLLLPPLRQTWDGTGSRARIIWVLCTGEHPGHQMFSHGPWPEYRHGPLGRRQMFRQSTKDSILGVEMKIMGCEGRSRTFEVVVRCATLLAYAASAGTRVDLTDTATVAANDLSSTGDRDRESTSVQALVGDAKTDNGAGGVGDDVPWDAWGPRATAMSDHEYVEWHYLLGERRATIERDTDQICIRDYNPYRIRQARASLLAEGLGGKSHGNVNKFHPKVIRRIIESSKIWGGQWFQEEVTTTLPRLDIVMDVPGCRAIYMEQDQVLLRVKDLDKITGRLNRMNGQDVPVEGFVLYKM